MREEKHMHTNRWVMSKTEAVAANGMVSSKHPLASRAGLEILQKGGNAVDAAVATAFAVGVVEPWMNGLGGGGFMVVHLAKAGRSLVIDYGMRAPAAAHPDLYQLEDGYNEDMFPWRKTRGDENVAGYKAIAVPGTVAGLSLALQQYGTMDLAAVMQPAIRYAEHGFPVDWHTMLQICADAEMIAKFPETAAVFFRNGFPRKPGAGAKEELLQQPDLAATLRRIASGGQGEFYRGETAVRIVRAMQTNGGLITAADLAGYTPIVHEPGLVTAYRDCQVVSVPAPSGGPTVAAALGLLSGFDLSAATWGGAASLHLVAEASRLAFADRYALLGESAGPEYPWQALLEPAYLAERRRLIHPDRAMTDVRDGGFIPDGSTTHLSVVDRDRNMVSLTQTLLSRFGSRVTIPGTGMLMNNGMLWFDPEPGRANSVAGGRRPLSNMAPLVILKDGRPWVTLGSSGGRRIMGANLQIAIDMIDYGMSIQEAISAPRVDLSTGKLLADSRLPAGSVARLRGLGHEVTVVTESILPHHFASPCGIMVDGAAGVLRGGADPLHPAVCMGY